MGDEDAPRALAAAREALAEAQDFDTEAVEAALAPLPERLGAKPGKVFQPIRVALTGSTVSPGIFETVALAGPGPADRAGFLASWRMGVDSSGPLRSGSEGRRQTGPGRQQE